MKIKKNEYEDEDEDEDEEENEQGTLNAVLLHT
jgi:hypothetical protein